VNVKMGEFGRHYPCRLAELTLQSKREIEARAVGRGVFVSVPCSRGGPSALASAENDGIFAAPFR
jgi:hypothetical protein